jgi:hypothetical protein
VPGDYEEGNSKIMRKGEQGKSHKHPELAGLHGVAYRKAWYQIMVKKRGTNYKDPARTTCGCGRRAIKLDPGGSGVCARCAKLEDELTQRELRKMHSGAAEYRPKFRNPEEPPPAMPEPERQETYLQRAWRELRDQMQITVAELKSYNERNDFSESI